MLPLRSVTWRIVSDVAFLVFSIYFYGDRLMGFGCTALRCILYNGQW